MAIESGWLAALPPFLVAVAVCMLMVPASMLLARRTGAVATPDDTRHLHPEPTPRLGGIAMFLGFGVALVLFGGDVAVRWQVLGVCAAITVAMAFDDIFDLPWWTKLAIEAATGLVTALVGILITFVALPSAGGVHLVDLGWLALPVTLVWVMGMQVSINFLDGSDGVAAGVVALVALVSLLAAINRLGSANHIQGGVVVLSGALMGCCVGFLVFNLPPAKTFMGDSGSHFLGVALAIITIVGVAKVAVGLSLLVPLVALGLPIGDTAFAIVRRRRAGVSAAMPDAGHLHHRLRARGMSPMETALTFYLATAILGCIALAFFGHRRILDGAVVLLLVALVLVWRRNRHREHRREIDEEGYLVVRGHRALAARSRGDGDVK